MMTEQQKLIYAIAFEDAALRHTTTHEMFFTYSKLLSMCRQPTEQELIIKNEVTKNIKALRHSSKALVFEHAPFYVSGNTVFEQCEAYEALNNHKDDDEFWVRLANDLYQASLGYIRDENNFQKLAKAFFVYQSSDSSILDLPVISTHLLFEQQLERERSEPFEVYIDRAIEKIRSTTADVMRTESPALSLVFRQKMLLVINHFSAQKEFAHSLDYVTNVNAGHESLLFLGCGVAVVFALYSMPIKSMLSGTLTPQEKFKILLLAAVVVSSIFLIRNLNITSAMLNLRQRDVFEKPKATEMLTAAGKLPRVSSTSAPVFTAEDLKQDAPENAPQGPRL